MIFDQPPAELPVATLRPRELEARLWLDARRWLAARWRWLRPRSIPVAVALSGTLGLYAAANYVGGETTQPWPDQSGLRAPAAKRTRALAPAAKLAIDTGPPGAVMTIDGEPFEILVKNHGGAPQVIAIDPGVYKIELERAAAPDRAGRVGRGRSRPIAPR